jgi:DNA gyrase inhibitor GyrI
MNDPRFSEISIQELPPMRLVSYRAISATPEEDVATYFARWTADQELPRDLPNFGFDVEVSAEQREEGLRGYELWLVTPAGVELAEGMQIRQFGGGLYAVMTIYDAMQDPFTHIPHGWEHLHHWVTRSPLFEAAEHQCLEEVVSDIDRSGRRHLVLYYPIAAIAEGVPA